MSYDSDIDAVYYNPGAACGITSGPPVEVLVALANKLNVGLWLNFPVLTIDTEVTSMVSYVKANLKSVLPRFYEWGNEIWNNKTGDTGLASFKGLCLSNGTAFVPGSNRNLFGYYALRCVQTMNMVSHQP